CNRPFTMLCERPSRRSDAKELHFRILAQPGCVFLEVPGSGCGMQIKFHPNPKNREKRRALSYS
ncbi:hypothetical protein, partial [Stutzerimonas balearica]|uniref:hypothetical protein n=1 Tax=Stutzerimonas balearica TaxID=74829 RepID=UPI00241DD5EC